MGLLNDGVLLDFSALKDNLIDTCASEAEISGETEFIFRPAEHCVLTNEGTLFRDSFDEIPSSIRTAAYSWRVLQQIGSHWAEVTYRADMSVTDGWFTTSGVSAITGT